MSNDFKRACQLLAGPPGHVHFVGICGVGMAGLAFHLKQKGWRVSGCDRQPCALATWLEESGIEIRGGHDPSHLDGVDWVVRTTAVRTEHSEIQAAEARKLPVLQRGVVLAALLSGTAAIIICGAHGKTTTTAMLTQILLAAGRDPSFCIGGESELLKVAGAGSGGCLVAEADESDGTIVDYEPDIAVVTNIEFDHAEHYPDTAALHACFAGMLRKVRRAVIYCADNRESFLLCHELPKTVSYGLSRMAEWRAAEIAETGEGCSFHVWQGDSKKGDICLPVAGRHNVLNALAACAAASVCGIQFDAMQKGLQSFQAVRRRFERVVAKDEVLVISDYAHHPTEIAATLQTIRRLPRKRWLTVFQPHRFSRTRALMSDFAAVLADVDELVLAPVYAASEPMVAGGTTWDLYARVRDAGAVHAYCADSVSQAWNYLRAVLRPGDGLLVLGAGDVDRIARWARTELDERALASLDPAHAWCAALEQLDWKSAVVERRAALGGRTTLHVGGVADIFVELKCEEDIVRLLLWTHKNRVRVTLLGAGSNVLVSDLGVRGVVARLAGCGFRQIRMEGKSRVIVGAGASLNELTSRLETEGCLGLEFLTGIPGCVGGALRMNAGAWGEDIGSHTAWVRCLNSDGSEQTMDPTTLGFAYRRSEGLTGKIAVEAAFNVDPSNPQTVRARRQEIFRRRAWLRPWPSAGSVFRNPEGGFAGRLLEQAGMKGRRLGGAHVIEEHANVIVTEPGAIASDVRALMEIMRQSVLDFAGVELKEEIIVLE